MSKIITRHRAGSAAISLLLAVLMLLSTAVIPQTRDACESSAATTFKDTGSHWAKNYITKAVNYGIVNGYADGTFQPDVSITRAEFTKILNATLGNNGTTDIGFWDIVDTDWYYADVQKGVAAGFISGRDATEFAPNDCITRQEAAVMLARVIPAYGSETSLKVYDDYLDVASWANAAMQKMTGKGYLGAYSDGKLYPTANLTRAQAAKILTSVLETENIDSNNKRIQYHDGPSLTLKNMIYSNNMTVDESCQDTLIEFSNCTILGKLVCEGGQSGVDAGIQLDNSRVSEAQLKSDADEVRLYAKGESTVKKAVLSDKAVLETGKLSGTGDFGKGFVSVEISRAADAALIGNFQDVTITGAKVDLSISEGQVENLTISKAAEKTNIDIAEGASIYNVDAYAPETAFTGKGNIIKLNAYANGITYETTPTRIESATSVNETPAAEQDPERALTITPTPEDKAVKVSTEEKITLAFSAPVHARADSSSSLLTNEEAESLISLRKGSSNGSTVAFTAEVKGDGKSVTLKPDETLKTETTYYLVINANELEDSYGHKNAAFSSSFTTGLAAKNIQFEPADASTSVSLTAVPTITFAEPVMRADSKSTSITDQYLKTSVLTVQKFTANQTSKTDVTFTASMDSTNRQITITPTEDLQEASTYFITIKGNTLATQSDGEVIKEQTISFITTASTLTNRSVTVDSANKVTLNFRAMAKGTVYAIIFKQKDLQKEMPTALQIKTHKYASGTSDTGHFGSCSVYKNENGTITFSNLDANTDYYVYFVLYENDNTPGGIFCETATTARKYATLSELNFDATVAGTQVTSYSSDLLKDAGSATDMTYYIGPKETNLTFKPVADYDSTFSYKMSFQASNSQYRDLSFASASGEMTITIPASDTISDIGTLSVVVSSTNSSYQTQTYTVNIERILPKVLKATVTGLDSAITTESSEEKALSAAMVPAEVDTSDMEDTDKIKLLPELQSSAVTYKVDYYYNGQWVSVSNYYANAATAIELGDAQTLRDQSGTNGIVYRITTVYKMYGTSESTGLASGDPEYAYIKVKFK